MDDMKGKVKGFMKKVNNPFSSSSSGKFKGQGRVLGSSSSGPSNPIHTRSPPPSVGPKPKAPSPSPTKPNPVPRTIPDPDQNKPNFQHNPVQNSKAADGFDPFDSLITSGKRSKHGYSLNVFECPICGQSFTSEEETTIHVDSCVNNGVENNDNQHSSELSNGDNGFTELEDRMGAFLSGEPSGGSVEVVLKLLRNIVKEPENGKFRRIRMGNPKIREAIGEVVGGVELLECVGFQLREEDGEMWAVMESPTKERIALMDMAVSLLDPQKIENSSTPVSAADVEEPAEPKRVDRQIRVFFSVPESVAAKIELPDSFFNLSVQELKREAETRKKKIAESQLLIPKSYKEKQAKIARRRYTKTVIRIQFPDGVVLQGVFSPWESTSALYEFVSSALKEPCLEFDLLHPVAIKRRVIPHSPGAGEKATTLDEEELVPSALIKFKPIETDSIVFLGLRNDLLEISEPLINKSAVPQA